MRMACVERLAPRRAALETSAGGAEAAVARAYSARVFCLILQCWASSIGPTYVFKFGLCFISGWAR